MKAGVKKTFKAKILKPKMLSQSKSQMNAEIKDVSSNSILSHKSKTSK